MKKCNGCGEEKPHTVEFFYRNGKWLRSTCKECKNKYNRQWNKDNEEHMRQWRKDNRERDAEIHRQWRKENREHYLEQARKQVAKRRAIKKGATKADNFSRQDVLDKWGTDCHICSDPIDLDDWHMDHVFPLSKGGEHSLANVKPSHPSCNMSKGAAIL